MKGMPIRTACSRCIYHEDMVYIDRRHIGYCRKYYLLTAVYKPNYLCEMDGYRYAA